MRVISIKGINIGYVRVSSLDQNTCRQLEGLDLDRVFTDKVSGKDINRPELDNLMQFTREGDTVIVHSMDRLARNLDDLRKIVRTLTEKGIKVQFIKENLIFSGDDSPLANLLLSVMGAFAEFERSLIRERQMEGIALAKQRGAYQGRKPLLTGAHVSEIRQRIGLGETKAKIARDLNISRETLYQYLRKE
jgi:DNA invertase Pin-like site-specific DNA recombinase